MSKLVVELLGPWRLTWEGAPVFEQAPAKWLALLAYLIVGVQERHPRSQLAALLWPEVPEALGKQNLRQLLFKVRRLQPAAFDALLDVSGTDLAFRREPGHEADVDRFLAAPADKRGNPQAWAAAMALYRGELLQDVAPRCGERFDEWLTLTRARCERHASALLGLLCRHHEQVREHEQALLFARRWIEVDPLQEPAHEHAARALLGLGRRAEAIAALDAARATLERELGIGLNNTLQALAREARSEAAHVPRDLGADLRPLPVPRTPLVGRVRELEGILALLNSTEARLVTLVGLGGSGKTRLALSIARTALERNLPCAAEGAAFVSLAASEGYEGMLEAVELGLRSGPPGGGALEDRVRRLLGQRRLLLVLDNFEHLAEHASRLLALLEPATGITMLITTRMPLNVHGEQLFWLGGLLGDAPETAPMADDARVSISDAQRLFVQCARRIAPHFSMDEAGEAAVARICRLVSGMPLAIELAAAWVAGMTPEAIADTLEQNIALLDEEAPSNDMRRSSMLGALAWSWERLTPTQQKVFAQLSVFRGGFTPAAALTVAGAAAPALASLTRRALLRFNPEHKPHGRYELLEVLRFLGAEHLSDEMREQVGAAHARWYLDLAQREARKLEQLESVATQAELRLELGNIRAAWTSAVQRADVTLLAACSEGVAQLFGFWGYVLDGAALLDGALRTAERAGATARERALLLLRRAQLDFVAGRAASARDDMMRALQPDSGIGYFDVERAEGALTLARINHSLSRTEDAAETIAFALHQARALIEATNNGPTPSPEVVARLRNVESKALAWQGNIAFQVLNIPDARRDLSAAIEAARASGLAFAEADARRGLGRLLAELGYAGEARIHLDKALAAFQTLGNPQSEFLARQHLFWLHLYAWDFGAAELELARSRRLLRFENQHILLGFVGAVQTVLLDRVGDFGAARAAVLATHDAYVQAGYTKGVGDSQEHAARIELRSGRLAEAVAGAEAAMETSGRVRHHQTVEQARITRARALIGLGRLDAAEAGFATARENLLALHLTGFAADACAGLAETAFARGDTAGALRALAPTFEPEMAQTRVVSTDPVWERWTGIHILRAAGDARADVLHAQLRADLQRGLASLPSPDSRARFLASPLVGQVLGEGE